MNYVLKPIEAAKLAVRVYDLQNGPYAKDDVAKFRNWEFDLGSKHARITGKSGTAFVVYKKTGFCSIARGVGETNKDDLLILTRGTDNAFDWCTDGTAGYTRSHSGFTVHTGFYKTFESILSEGLQFQFNNFKSIRKVHCVGHSLGGALATLIAEWAALQKKADEVALYTFGSPRVGFSDYSQWVEKLLGKENIYRVFHQQDPVPWVPVWPFVHIPQISHYRLGGSGERYINPSKHSMIKSYEQTIGASGILSWEALEDRSWSPPSQAALKQWLESDSVMSFCSNTLTLLGAAIVWVFEVALEALSISAQLFLSGAITSLDLLAEILMNAAKSGSEEVSGLVKNLIKKIDQFNGRPPLMDSQINKTSTMLAFQDMQKKLKKEVQGALAQAVKSEAA